jgi:hypothetical protein
MRQLTSLKRTQQPGCHQSSLLLHVDPEPVRLSQRSVHNETQGYTQSYPVSNMHLFKGRSCPNA